jgi:tetratricopeptide (TPR) repeat protein
VLIVCCGFTTGLWAQTGAVARVETAGETNLVPRLLEAFTQLQAQHDTTIRALGDARMAAAAAAEKNAQQLNERVQQIEDSLRRQHEREIATLRDAHRSTLQAVSAVAAIAFLVVVSFALLFLRGMSRKAAPSQLATVAPGNLAPVEPSTSRLLNAVNELEQRLEELETASHTPSLPATAEADSRTQVELLLGKGQSLLGMQRTEEALACIEEAIRLNPDNPDAFVLQGMTLEKLERLDDAMAAYDEAISLDERSLMAHLRKGGVLNRLERHPEAVACYERALLAQEKLRSA